MDSLAERHPNFLRTENWPAPFPQPKKASWFASEWFLISVDQETGEIVFGDRRYVLPMIYQALVEKPDLPLCQLHVANTARGPVCLSLTLTGTVAGVTREPLTSSRIRVPLDGLLKELTIALGGFNLQTGAHEPEEFERELVGYVGPRPEPGKRVPDEIFQEVATVYRYAAGRGLPPTNAVAEALSVSRSTAGRYVVQARRRGFLGPAIPGQAGEQLPAPKEEQDA